MQQAVIVRLEELTRKGKTRTSRFTDAERTQIAWEHDLTEEVKIFPEGSFATEEEAAAAGFGKLEEHDGIRRYYKTTKRALDLTDEECEALSQAAWLSRGPAVPETAGRVLTVFGVLFVLAFAVLGVLQGAEHKSWLRWLAVTIPGVLWALTMFWVGRLIGEVRVLRGMLLRVTRRL